MNTNQKGFANIILVVAVIVILTGAVGYFVFVKKSEPIAQQIPTPTPPTNQVSPTPTPIPSPTPTPTDPTVNWKTYTSSKLDISFRYPDKYFVKEAEYSDSVIITDDAHYGITDACNGYYNINSGTLEQGQSFDSLGKEKTYDYLSNLNIQKITVDGYAGFYVTGVYNKSFTGWGVPSKGDSYLGVVFTDGLKDISIRPCASSDQKEFDWIVYSMKFNIK